MGTPLGPKYLPYPYMEPLGFGSFERNIGALGCR